MTLGRAWNLFIEWKIERELKRADAPEKFSTDSEEIDVEIDTISFTKLLQMRSYNILHTSAACVETLAC